MAGLVNGRRGGRASSLMIAALFACVLVLGFNYWVSSTHNLELQTRLYELESQMQHSEMERMAVEGKKNELESEIQQQKQQITFIESSYKAHEEEADGLCSEEKAAMMQNISSSTQTIQDLKDQLRQIKGQVTTFANIVTKCQGDVDALKNRYTNELARCQSEVQSKKEECDAKVAALKVDPNDQKNNPVPVEAQDNAGVEGGKENVMAENEFMANEPQVNDVDGGKDADAPVEVPPVNNAPAAGAEPGEQQQQQQQPGEEAIESIDEAKAEFENQMNEQAENKMLEDVDVLKDDAPPDGPGMEDGELLDQDAAGQDGNDLQEPVDYDLIEQGVGDPDAGDEQLKKQEEILGFEDGLKDYDGDDENKGEFEADKQAELAQV